MTKELRPSLHDVACDVCGRTILKGERTETYLAPGGQRKAVCQLCASRAEGEGWIRESAAADLPAESWPEPRPGLLSRLLRGWTGDGRPASADEPKEAPAMPAGAADAASLEPSLDPPRAEAPPEPARPDHSGARPVRPRGTAPRRTDARHVRAVPTNAQVKVERALELFNGTEHTRTIAGIARSLGDPWVTAVPLEDAPSEVVVVVAWELSWYRYRIDLGDAETPVVLAEKGYELNEIDEALRDWNGAATASGHLTLGARSL